MCTLCNYFINTGTVGTIDVNKRIKGIIHAVFKLISKMF